jgi:hypothetical protein
MFWIRFIILSLCLGATVWHLEREQRAGRFQKVDDLFLDFLVANARERLSQPEVDKENPVVLVSLREDQKMEYAAWPPPPLDWQTILKGLQVYEPSVVVIPTPLFWGRPAPDFVRAVGEALMPFSSVVLGVETELATADSAAPAFMGGIEDALPIFKRLDGSEDDATTLSALITAPDELLRARCEIGLAAVARAEGKPALAYAIRESENLYPSVLAQTLARFSGTPYALHRLRLGPGAGAYLNEGLFVALEKDGVIHAESDTEIPSINALHLMTGTLADGLSAVEKATLGKGRVIVIGSDVVAKDQPPSLARLHAQILSQILSRPRLHVLTQVQQWVAWGVAGLAAFWIGLRTLRGRALRAGLSMIFAVLLVSFLAFQASLIWCPPTMLVSLIAVGAVIGRLFGRQPESSPEISPEASPPASN